MTCTQCRYKCCKYCNQQQHKYGEKCLVMQKFFENKQNQIDISICPGCYYPQSRSGGCNHITCKMCQNNYCFICHGQYYEQQHHCGNNYQIIQKFAEYFKTDSCTFQFLNNRKIGIPLQNGIQFDDFFDD
ncbi:hypothetical protein PPERSA_05482 [Pseudocohnilembus persalinus]|uniref:RING-type domain-containing protein n=1 Tax=Pseudocohnilembus persalinus TaxID=266149 RepID=A0A0V0R847_PSEPJ|nr:hypothetical protein PPERSA_05482 [Pseudocohnilembus persalinus]|eukprot:KRX10662.1 hypothetical protein PPERSA_05482 [Pseudocohnilembus persalinus]